MLWKGSKLSSTRAKVAWEHVYLPKNEGALGISRMEEWNRGAMLKQLTDSNQSIWSKWVCTNLIRNRNFWTLKALGDYCWTMRKNLKLREVARDKLCFFGG